MSVQDSNAFYHKMFSFYLTSSSEVHVTRTVINRYSKSISLYKQKN